MNLSLISWRPPKNDEIESDCKIRAPVNFVGLIQSNKWRLLHAFISAIQYGLSLMLMLVAMTYNPSLFVALITGYFVGDFLFYSPSLSGGSQCH